MKKISLLIFLFFISIGFSNLFAQCMMIPLSIDERVLNAETIILGKLKSQECYWDERMENIYTSNIISVTAYLKGHQTQNEIVLITEGGIVEDQAQITRPSISLDQNHEFILILDKEDFKNDNKLFRQTKPSLKQAKAYGSNQGLLVLENGKYYDLLKEAPKTEAEIITLIQDFTSEIPQKPTREVFTARKFEEKKASSPSPSGSSKLRTASTQSVSSFSPTTTVAGSINVGDFVTITGSAFGTTQGTGAVYFTNADDGGATFTATSFASDYVSWSDNSITVKVPDGAGTGNIIVITDGGTSFPSSSPLTVTYSHVALTSTINSWPVDTRMRAYLRNMNGTGGYTFLYNSTGTNGSSIAFSAQTTAKAAFERALQSWRCATFVNFSVSPTSTTLGIANDNSNVISFDAGLQAGVLGLTNSRYSTSTNAGCTQANTVWCIREIDIQFDDVLSSGFTWQFGPAAPSASQYDFESVSVHELGHAHGLGHIINSGKVMHYSISNGASVRNLNPTTETAGGTAKMSYSTPATCHNPSVCGSGPMVALSAGTCALSLGIISFEGHHEEISGNHLEWTMLAEKNTTIDLMRSSDGINFNIVSSLNTGLSNGLLQMEYMDADVINEEIYFYKLSVRTEYESAYSSIISIAMHETDYTVFYNDSDKQIHIKPGTFAKNIFFYLYDIRGTLIDKKEFNIESNIEKTLSYNALSDGIYMYCLNTGNRIYTGKLLIE